MDRGQELLTIRFENIAPAEYQQAYKAASRAQRQQVAAVFTIFLLAFFFLIYWLLDRDPIVSGIVVMVLLLILLYLKWQQNIQLKEAGRRNDKDMPIQITFTESGTVGVSQYSENFRKWEGYAGYLETPGTITLVLPIVLIRSYLNALWIHLPSQICKRFCSRN